MGAVWRSSWTGLRGGLVSGLLLRTVRVPRMLIGAVLQPNRYESIPPFLIITFGVAGMGALQHGFHKLTNWNNDFKVSPPPLPPRPSAIGECVCVCVCVLCG